jgi:hypothetical protein
MIDVRCAGDGDPLEFDVTVREGGGETRHAVTMTRSDHARLDRHGKSSPEACIEAAFRFLLDREPKEAILDRFDVMVVARYFPEFETALPGYLDETSAGEGNGRQAAASRPESRSSVTPRSQ